MSNLIGLLLYDSLSARSDVEPIDPILTLDKEAKYFWKVPGKAVDYVFFLNRYVGILGAVACISFDTFRVNLVLCNFASWTRDIANWVTITSIDYILTIRVLALYSQDRRLSMILHLLLGLDSLVKLGLVIYLGILQHSAVGGLAENATACGIDNIPPWQLGMVDWLTPLTYGAILMVLALWKAAEFWKLSAGFKGFRLVKVLIRDQVWYFLLAIPCSVFSILQFRIQISNEFLSDVLAQLGYPAFLTLLGSRLLFNTKEAGERGLNEGTSCDIQSSTISSIDFAEPANPQRQSQTDDVEGGMEET